MDILKFDLTVSGFRVKGYYFPLEITVAKEINSWSSEAGAILLQLYKPGLHKELCYSRDTHRAFIMREGQESLVVEIMNIHETSGPYNLSCKLWLLGERSTINNSVMTFEYTDTGQGKLGKYGHATVEQILRSL